MTEDTAFNGDARQEQIPLWQTLVGIAVLLALVVAAIVAVAQIYPSRLPTTKNPSQKEEKR